MQCFVIEWGHSDMRTKRLAIVIVAIVVAFIASLAGSVQWAKWEQRRVSDIAQAAALVRQTDDIATAQLARPAVIAHISAAALRSSLQALEDRSLRVRVGSTAARFEIHHLDLDLEEAFAGVGIDATVEPSAGRAVKVSGVAELRFLRGEDRTSMHIALNVRGLQPVFKLGRLTIPLPKFLTPLGDAALQKGIDEALGQVRVSLRPTLPIRFRANDFGPIEDVKIGESARLTFALDSGLIDRQISLSLLAPIIDARHVHLVLLLAPPEGEVAVTPSGPSTPLSFDVPGDSDVVLSIDEDAIDRILAHVTALSPEQRTVGIRAIDGGGRLVIGRAAYRAGGGLPQQTVVGATIDTLSKLLSTGSQLCPVEYDAHVSSDHDIPVRGAFTLQEVVGIAPWTIRATVAYQASARVRAGAEFTCLRGGKATMALGVHAANSLTVVGKLIADDNGLGLEVVEPTTVEIPYVIDGAEILKHKWLGSWRWPDLTLTTSVPLPKRVPLLEFTPGCQTLALDPAEASEARMVKLAWNIEKTVLTSRRLDLHASISAARGRCGGQAASE